jgi:threonine dehydrogenase-like Zn-dependent dehydrogenase
VIRITTTTICGTDVHIIRGEYPVKPGLILGHEPVGVIEALGATRGALRRRSTRPRGRDYTDAASASIA